MTFDNVQSFIPKAFADLLGRNGHVGNLANFVTTFDDGEQATEVEAIEFSIQQAAVTCYTDGDEAPFHVFSVLSFYQKLMDKCCWNARSLMKANDKPDNKNGVDPIARAAEKAGVHADKDEIKKIIAEDYRVLLISFSEALNVAEVTEDMDLFYFNPSEQIDGIWEEPYRAEDFDAAFSAMEVVIERLDEQKATKLAELKAAREARLAERLAA